MDERAPKTYLPWWRFLASLLWPLAVWAVLPFCLGFFVRQSDEDAAFAAAWLGLPLLALCWLGYCVWAVVRAARRLRPPWAVPAALSLLLLLPPLPFLDELLCAPQFNNVCRNLKTELADPPDPQNHFHDAEEVRVPTTTRRCLLPWMRITVDQERLLDHATGETLAARQWAHFHGGWLMRALSGRGAACTSFYRNGFCYSESLGLKFKLRRRGIREYAAPLPQYPTSPSDEAMLEHFRANRAAFEELTRYYRTRLFAGREYAEQSYPFKQWKGAPPEPGDADMDALLRRAGAARVVVNRNDWLPDPYNPETTRRNNARIDKCRREAPDWQAKFRCRYTSPEHAALLIFPEAGGDDGKVWLHIPVVPKIERGVLLGPVNAHGVPSSATFMRDSLNLTPPHWEKGECVLRPIDAQWFLRLCRAREE